MNEPELDREMRVEHLVMARHRYYGQAKLCRRSTTELRRTVVSRVPAQP